MNTFQSRQVWLRAEIITKQVIPLLPDPLLYASQNYMLGFIEPDNSIHVTDSAEVPDCGPINNDYIHFQKAKLDTGEMVWELKSIGSLIFENVIIHLGSLRKLKNAGYKTI